MSRRVWKAVETEVGKTRIVKTKGRRSKRGSRKETRRESKAIEKEVEKEKDNNCKKSSRRLGDLEWEREHGEVRSRDEKTGSRKIS